MLGSRDEAEDVAQEVFLSFGRSTVPADEAGGWLTVAADPHRPEPLRSGRRRASREESRPSPTPCPAHHVPDVADLVVTREERSRVRAALGPLPQKQAAALVLRHSGLSYAEVAAALSMSPGSVGTTVRRAESVTAQGVEPPCVIPSEGVLRRLVDEPAGVTDDDRAHVADCPTCLRALDDARADAAARRRRAPVRLHGGRRSTGTSTPPGPG